MDFSITDDIIISYHIRRISRKMKNTNPYHYDHVNSEMKDILNYFVTLTWSQDSNIFLFFKANQSLLIDLKKEIHKFYSENNKKDKKYYYLYARAKSLQQTLNFLNYNSESSSARGHSYYSRLEDLSKDLREYVNDLRQLFRYVQRIEITVDKILSSLENKNNDEQTYLKENPFDITLKEEIVQEYEFDTLIERIDDFLIKYKGVI